MVACVVAVHGMMRQGGAPVRLFVCALSVVGALVTANRLTGSQPETPPARRLVEAGDMRFEGTFLLPQLLGNDADTRILGRAGCLTHRYVDGELYLMAGGGNNRNGSPNGEPYRVSLAPLRTERPYNVAIEVKRYGDVYSGKRVGVDDVSISHDFLGCYWDESTQRWYATYGDGYWGGSGDVASVVVSSLDEGRDDSETGSGTGIAAYKFDGLGYKHRQTGVLPIPDDFAEAHTGGRRLGIGLGGYFSLFMTAGGVSMGPSLVAFDPPKGPHLASLPWTPLVQYPGSLDPKSSVDRANRPAGAAPVQQFLDEWPNTKFTWTDWVGGAVWIRTPTLQGLMFFVTLGTGAAEYVNSQFGAEGAESWALVYDEDDLARVAEGQVDPDDIQPKASWKIEYPGLDYGSFPFAHETKACRSVTVSSTNVTFECDNHGFETEQRIRLYGASQEDFNGGYRISQVIDAHRFVGSNVNKPSFSTSRVTGRLSIKPLWIYGPPGHIFGATFDPVSRRLFIAAPDGVPWPQSSVAVHVYQFQ